jgi:hypothetical protein
MGQAYFMYVGDNKGFLPHVVYPSWQLRSTDPPTQPFVHWYVALSPYMGKKIDWDQSQTPWRRITDYSQVIRSCPSWKVEELGIPNTPGNDYLTGYGQNVTLFLGSGKRATGSEQPAQIPFGDPSGLYCGIHNNGGFNWAVGAVKLASIHHRADGLPARVALAAAAGLRHPARRAQPHLLRQRRAEPPQPGPPAGRGRHRAGADVRHADDQRAGRQTQHVPRELPVPRRPRGDVDQ